MVAADGHPVVPVPMRAGADDIYPEATRLPRRTPTPTFWFHPSEPRPSTNATDCAGAFGVVRGSARGAIVQQGRSMRVLEGLGAVTYTRSHAHRRLLGHLISTE